METPISEEIACMSRISAISRAMARACANSSVVIRVQRARRIALQETAQHSHLCGLLDRRLLTEIPRRGLKVSSPSLANSRIASRTGVMLTPSKDEMCAWVSLCPGRKQPENIASRATCDMIRSVPFPSSAKCGNFGELIFLVGPADLAMVLNNALGHGGAPRGQANYELRDRRGSGRTGGGMRLREAAS